MKKPCPWCGEDNPEDLSAMPRADGAVRINCPCGASGPTSGDAEGAIFQWNHRVKLQDPRLAELITAATDVYRLSERSTAQWDRLRAAIAAYREVKP